MLSFKTNNSKERNADTLINVYLETLERFNSKRVANEAVVEHLYRNGYMGSTEYGKRDILYSDKYESQVVARNVASLGVCVTDAVNFTTKDSLTTSVDLFEDFEAYLYVQHLEDILFSSKGIQDIFYIKYGVNILKSLAEPVLLALPIRKGSDKTRSQVFLMELELAGVELDDMRQPLVMEKFNSVIKTQYERSLILYV